MSLMPLPGRSEWRHFSVIYAPIHRCPRTYSNRPPALIPNPYWIRSWRTSKLPFLVAERSSRLDSCRKYEFLISSCNSYSRIWFRTPSSIDAMRVHSEDTSGAPEFFLALRGAGQRRLASTHSTGRRSEIFQRLHSDNTGGEQVWAWRFAAGSSNDSEDGFGSSLSPVWDQRFTLRSRTNSDASSPKHCILLIEDNSEGCGSHSGSARGIRFVPMFLFAQMGKGHAIYLGSAIRN